MSGFRVLLLPLFILVTTGHHAFSAELELVDHWFVKDSYELSGLAFLRGKLLTVSDEKDHKAVFEVALEAGKAPKKLKVYTDLSKLGGYDTLLKDLDAAEARRPDSGRFDLEGIAVCGDDTYLANERAHLVHRIRGQTIETLALRRAAMLPELEQGGVNTGFEGIAVDCQEQVLYIAKERSPRMIYVWNLRDLSFKEKFDVEASERDGQRYLNPDEGDGLQNMTGDLADLYFEAGYLYALERNTREVAKIDVQKKKVIARHSFLRMEWALYDTPLPFGQTEGLVMDKDFIYLSIDNNHNYLTHAAEKKYGIKGNPGFIAKLKRPSGF